jgi:lysophospholipase L1-like esterase
MTRCPKLLAARRDRRRRSSVEPLEARLVPSPAPVSGADQVGVYLPDKNLFAMATLAVQPSATGSIARANVFSYGSHSSATFSIPLEGDFRGDGNTDVGVYLPDKDLFALTYLDSKQHISGQAVFAYGFHDASSYAVPLAGDFNGGGITDVGVYLPDKDLFALAFLNAQGKIIGQSVFAYGYHSPGTFAIPLVGDFNGDGITDVGVYLPDKDLFALAFLNAQGKIIGQSVFTYGFHTAEVFAEPIVGDFNGDGTTDIGVYLPDESLFALAYLNTSGKITGRRVFNFGDPNPRTFAVPITGDFNGDGITDVGLYLPKVDDFALAYLDAKGNISGQINFNYGYHTPGIDAVPLPVPEPGLTPAVMPNQRLDPAAVVRHASDLAVAKAGGSNVVFFGDSIIDWFANGAGASVWSSEIAPLGAADFGLSGDRTQDLLWRLQNGELNGHPKVAVVLIGTNNLVFSDHDETPGEVIEGIRAVIQTIRTLSPQTRILLLGLLPRYQSPNDPVRTEIREVNSMIAGFADHAYITYLDVGSLFLSPDGTIPTYLMADFTHPTTVGYQVLANALLPTLKSMLNSPAPG